MDAMNPAAARIARVNGPLVEVSGLAGAAMYDVVELGEHRLPGEIVAIRGDVATVQAYEYTGGLAPGHPARARGEPLSAQLGPHLRGGVFDGLPSPLVATRYHSLVIDPASMPDCLEVTATCDEIVMGVRHRELPVEGVQFHPESVLTPRGKDMLRNFLAS